MFLVIALAAASTPAPAPEPSGQPTIEDILATVGRTVIRQEGSNFSSLIEAFVCSEPQCKTPMARLSAATFMRAVYVHGRTTTPNVMAVVRCATQISRLHRCTLRINV